MTIVVAAVVGFAPASARADQRGDLQAKGEQLAKDGRYGEAIDAFKQADRLEPKASHACLIALAYMRRESWPQAELFLSICHQRAGKADPLPDWVPLADQQIKERLQAANVAEVTIEVKPADAHASVTVSSFAPDEVFEPRTIHLPVGRHVLFARAEGHPNAQQTITLDGTAPQHVVIDLDAQPARPTPVETPRKRGTALLVAGGITVLAGAGTHAWMAYERTFLTTTPQEWDDHNKLFDVAKYSTIGLYTVGAGLIVTGIILRRSTPSTETPVVSAVPLDGGAFVSVGWQR